MTKDFLWYKDLSIILLCRFAWPGWGGLTCRKTISTLTNFDRRRGSLHWGRITRLSTTIYPKDRCFLGYYVETAMEYTKRDCLGDAERLSSTGLTRNHMAFPRYS